MATPTPLLPFWKAPQSLGELERLENVREAQSKAVHGQLKSCQDSSESFSCQKCNAVFPTYELFTYHVNAMCFKNDANIPCDHCGYICKSIDAYDLHQKVRIPPKHGCVTVLLWFLKYFMYSFFVPKYAFFFFFFLICCYVFHYSSFSIIAKNQLNCCLSSIHVRYVTSSFQQIKPSSVIWLLFANKKSTVYRAGFAHACANLKKRRLAIKCFSAKA